MENICSEGPSLWSQSALTDASGLELAITTTNFISALVITNQALHYLQSLTISLQGESKDIITAVNEINTVITLLQKVQDNIDSYHLKWFDTIKKMCQDINTEPSTPRT